MVTVTATYKDASKATKRDLRDKAPSKHSSDKRHLCKSLCKVAVMIQRHYLAVRKTLLRNDGRVWWEKLSKDWHQSQLSVCLC